MPTPAPIGLTDQQLDTLVQAAAPLAGTTAAPIRTNYGTGFQKKNPASVG
jgi:hypothetical protein